MVDSTIEANAPIQVILATLSLALSARLLVCLSVFALRRMDVLLCEVNFDGKYDLFPLLTTSSTVDRAQECGFWKERNGQERNW